MVQGRKGKLNYRCPWCLMREIDMDVLYLHSSSMCVRIGGSLCCP
jgi:hypothetical protein